MRKNTNRITVQTTKDGHITVAQPSLLGAGQEAFVTLTPDEAALVSTWLTEAITEARHRYKPD